MSKTSGVKYKVPFIYDTIKATTIVIFNTNRPNIMVYHTAHRILIP
jgi:hypothetical protein